METYKDIVSKLLKNNPDFESLSLDKQKRVEDCCCLMVDCSFEMLSDIIGSSQGSDDRKKA